MGAYLSEPITEKKSTDEENERVRYGVSSMQGWRISQEVNALFSYKTKPFYCVSNKRKHTYILR